eukprot:29612-Pelagococcus_subviridis.AAC.6
MSLLSRSSSSTPSSSDSSPSPRAGGSSEDSPISEPAMTARSGVTRRRRGRSNGSGRKSTGEIPHHLIVGFISCAKIGSKIGWKI